MPSETAFKVFKLSALGYCCTQIMLIMALEEEGNYNEDLVKSGKQKTCGILIGGIMILGLYAGKGKDEEYYEENYGNMVHRFTDWFEEEFESMDCIDIIGVNKFDDGENSYMLKCGDIIIKSYNKVKEILTENGYEFGVRNE
jgi:hypothetical protein